MVKGKGDQSQTERAECKLPDGYLKVGNTLIIIEREDPHREFVEHLKKHANMRHLKKVEVGNG